MVLLIQIRAMSCFNYKYPAQQFLSSFILCIRSNTVKDTELWLVSILQTRWFVNLLLYEDTNDGKVLWLYFCESCFSTFYETECFTKVCNLKFLIFSSEQAEQLQTVHDEKNAKIIFLVFNFNLFVLFDNLQNHQHHITSLPQIPGMSFFGCLLILTSDG